MAVATTNLGVITAYGDAVAAGYTGTKAEWQTLMASYATVAEEANEAKDAAVSAKDTAVAKATEATTAANTANTAKDTATSKATEATTAANTATTKANEASASAQSIAQSASQIAQNTSDISELKEDLTDKADTVDMLKAFPTDTASGSVASFADGANVPVKSLVVNIDPVQSGSGDPSPTNICPISGWSEVNINACGANVLDESTFTQYGAVKQSDGSWFASNIVDLLSKICYVPPTGYMGRLAIVFKRKTGQGRQSLRLIVNYTDGTNGYLGFSQATGGWDTYTLVTDVSKVVSSITFDYGGNVATYYNIMIAMSATIIPYEPYIGHSITIDLGQTVYGGTLDVTKGELVIDYAKITIDGSSTIGRTGSSVSSPVLIQVIPPANNIAFVDENTIPRCLCGSYLPPTTAYGIYRSADLCIAINQAESRTSRRIWMRLPEVTTEAQAKTYLTNNPIEVVYPIDNPLTITLTPHELSTLLGANNIWSDAGEVTAEYRADPTLFIQKKIAEAISALS